MNIPSMGAATASGMPVGQQPAVGLSQAATTSPATNFTHHHILGDGDSLFRATYMGLSNQPGVEPSQDQVAGLRQYLADYVYRHQDALSANPAFGGQQGVMNLYDLLLTPGQWDHSAGDLVAPLLAQVSGRALAVLQAVQEGAAYSVRQVFPAENPSLPPGSGQTGEPSICLAHINGNHYAYLEQRYPGVLPDLLNQPWERENLPSPSHYLNDQGPGAIMSEEPSQKTQGENKRGKTSARKSQISQMQRDTLAHLWRDNPQWGLRKISNEFNRRYPGLNVTQSVVRAMKKSHSDLRGLNLGSQSNEPKLSDTQRKALIELWKQNASWGETKIAKEYNERNPGAEITSSTVRNMKRRYPGLQGLKLGSEKNGKKLSDEQRQEIAQLWRQNPQWNEEQMAREYIDRNPGVKVIGGLAHQLKGRHPYSLSGFGDISAKYTPLNSLQQQALAELWLENPTWSRSKMAMEFNKRNPGLLISSDQAYRLRHKHPDLKDQPLMKASSNVSPTKRSEHIKKQLSFLDNKMKCIGPLDQASKQQQSRYQHYLNQFRALQQTLSHLSTLEPVSEQAPLETERDGAVLSNLSGEHLSQGLPSEATSSQNIFNVLTDFDQLSGQLAMPESPSISDVDSLAVFALLNDGDEVTGGRS